MWVAVDQKKPTGTAGATNTEETVKVKILVSHVVESEIEVDVPAYIAGVIADGDTMELEDYLFNDTEASELIDPELVEVLEVGGEAIGEGEVEAEEEDGL